RRARRSERAGDQGRAGEGDRAGEVEGRRRGRRGRRRREGAGGRREGRRQVRREVQGRRQGRQGQGRRREVEQVEEVEVQEEGGAVAQERQRIREAVRRALTGRGRRALTLARPALSPTLSRRTGRGRKIPRPSGSGPLAPRSDKRVRVRGRPPSTLSS